jgi:GYF domain 2
LVRDPLAGRTWAGYSQPRFAMSTSSKQAKRWFYVRDGRRQGPVETDRLVDLVLNGEVAEDGLVWHSGLTEWLRARDIEEIRRELPPPVPTPSPARFPEPLPDEAVNEGEDTAPDEAPDGPGAGSLGDGSFGDLPSEAESENGEDPKRRRKRKHRNRDTKRRPAWLWPLVAILVALMIFLWWLLRRMNEVPPGRIIQTGFLLQDRSRSPALEAAFRARDGKSLALVAASRPGAPPCGDSRVNREREALPPRAQA